MPAAGRGACCGAGRTARPRCGDAVLLKVDYLGARVFDPAMVADPGLQRRQRALSLLPSIAHPLAPFTIAMMPARSGSGRDGHAAIRTSSSG
jgi:hypothetical protein